MLRFERRLAHPIERVWEALDARDVKLEIEAEYAAVVGEERMRSLRSALEELLEHEEGAGP